MWRLSNSWILSYKKTYFWIKMTKNACSCTIRDMWYVCVCRAAKLCCVSLPLCAPTVCWVRFDDCFMRRCREVHEKLCIKINIHRKSYRDDMSGLKSFSLHLDVPSYTCILYACLCYTIRSRSSSMHAETALTGSNAAALAQLFHACNFGPFVETSLPVCPLSEKGR